MLTLFDKIISLMFIDPKDIILRHTKFYAC